jgi:hypothetical protein
VLNVKVKKKLIHPLASNLNIHNNLFRIGKSWDFNISRSFTNWIALLLKVKRTTMMRPFVSHEKMG